MLLVCLSVATRVLTLGSLLAAGCGPAWPGQAALLCVPGHGALDCGSPPNPNHPPPTHPSPSRSGLALVDGGVVGVVTASNSAAIKLWPEAELRAVAAGG